MLELPGSSAGTGNGNGGSDIDGSNSSSSIVYLQVVDLRPAGLGPLYMDTQRTQLSLQVSCTQSLTWTWKHAMCCHALHISSVHGVHVCSFSCGAAPGTYITL